MHDLLEIDVLAVLDRDARVGPREQKEIVDDARHSARGALHHAERRAIVGLRASRLGQRDVGLGAHDRRRRAQLVRRVGHESLLLDERCFEPIEEAVHHARQPGELVAASDRKTILQVRRADLRRARRHRRERHEIPRREEIAAGDRADEEQRHREDENLAHALEHRLACRASE